jgi:hypothetical protein
MELTLSCDGDADEYDGDSDAKPESVTKMGVLVNLRDGTVLGFGHPTRIKGSDAASMEFEGQNGTGQRRVQSTASPAACRQQQ